LFELCQANPELRIERSAEGDLIVMPPVTGETGWRNAEVTIALGAWAHQDRTGVVFDSSTGFLLPNGAMRSPDAAWVRRERLGKLSPEQKRKFIPLCPDFVAEIRSATDSLRMVRAKMEEYIANGAALGWLIDPSTRRLSVYHPDKPVEMLLTPSMVSGDPVLPGFVFEVGRIWDVGF
jgi:Uma2 family endonuclease